VWRQHTHDDPRNAWVKKGRETPSVLARLGTGPQKTTPWRSSPTTTHSAKPADKKKTWKQKYHVAPPSAKKQKKDGGQRKIKYVGSETSQLANSRGKGDEGHQLQPDQKNKECLEHSWGHQATGATRNRLETRPQPPGKGCGGGEESGNTSLRRGQEVPGLDLGNLGRRVRVLLLKDVE